MKAYYVELKRKVPETFGREVAAETEEAAVDQVLLAAPGDPRDWEVIIVQPGLKGTERFE